MSKKQKYDSKKQQFKGKGFYGDPAAHEKIIYDSLIQEGASHAIAAAIVGNLKHETGGFKFVEETKPNKHGEYGLGLLQWSRERGVKFRNWLSKNNKDPRDLAHNVEFMIKELREGTAWTKGMSWDKFNKIKDVGKAVEVFADTYLRPEFDENGKRSGLKERLTYAQKFMGKGGNYTDPKLLTKEYDVIPKQRDINIGIDAMLKNINFSKSTISMEDLDAIEDRASSFIRSGGESAIGSTNPIDKIIESGYERADVITMEDIISSHRDPNWRVADYMKEVEAEQRLKASENGGLPSQNQMALGGQLQPNGRLSQFTREEDLQAQNNTSYSPMNRFEDGGPINPYKKGQLVSKQDAKQMVLDYKNKQAVLDNDKAFRQSKIQAEKELAKEYVQRNMKDIQDHPLWQLPGMMSPMTAENLVIGGLSKGYKAIKALKAIKPIASSVDDVGKFNVKNDYFYRSIDLDDAVNSGLIRSKTSGEYAEKSPYFVEGADFEKLYSTGAGATASKPKYIFEMPMVDKTGENMTAFRVNQTSGYAPYTGAKPSIPISEGKIYKLNDKGQYVEFKPTTSSVDGVGGGLIQVPQAHKYEYGGTIPSIGPIGPQPQQTVVKTRPDYTTSSQIIPEYNTVVPYMDKAQPYINKGTTFEQNTKKEFNDWYTNSITAQRLKKQTNYNTEQISDMLANAASTRMNRTNNVGLNENAQYTDRTRTIDYNKQDPNVIKHELSHASGLDQQLGEYLLKTTGYPSEQKTNYLSDVQNYLAKPHEAYGNFVEFRAALGLKPGQKIKDIKTLEKLIQQKKVDTNYSRTFDLENILKALNTMADNSNIPTKSNALFNGNLPKEIV